MGAAGVGCDGNGFAGRAAFGFATGLGSGGSTAGASSLSRLTSSNILLVVGVIGVTGAATDAVGVAFFEAAGAFGASFFAAVVVFAVLMAVFFLGSTTFSLGADFAASFFTAVFLTSARSTDPTSSVTAFLGRPRFFATGGSSVVDVDMVAPPIGVCCRRNEVRRRGLIPRGWLNRGHAKRRLERVGRWSQGYQSEILGE